jgi:threonine/homoserine/homoserine lactone efflux protein
MAATAGLSTILLASAAAYSSVKALGAVYLIYLGIRTLVGPATSGSIEDAAPRSLCRLFYDGAVVSVLNPKIAVFFMAFLPQFADPRRGSVPLQVFLFGLVYCMMALLTDGGYALLASQLRRRFGGRVARSQWPRCASATVYIVLGVGTALADQHG